MLLNHNILEDFFEKKGSFAERLKWGLKTGLIAGLGWTTADILSFSRITDRLVFFMRHYVHCKLWFILNTGSTLNQPGQAVKYNTYHIRQSYLWLCLFMQWILVLFVNLWLVNFQTKSKSLLNKQPDNDMNVQYKYL